MKKVISLILALAILAGMMPMTALTAGAAMTGMPEEGSDHNAAAELPDRDFSQLTYVAFGDSITYGVDGNYQSGPGRIMENPFPKLVGEQLGFRSVNNQAVSGGTLCADSGHTNMTERILHFNGKADVISIMLGVNDYQVCCPLGDIDSTDNKTIYGSLNLICQNLTQYYPDAFVFFMTPFQYRGGEKDRGAGYNLSVVANAVKEVAAKYQLPVLDMYTYGRYEEEFNDTSLPYQDGIHPSQQHHIKYTAPMIAEFIVNNCPEIDCDDAENDQSQTERRIVYRQQDLISGYCTKYGKTEASSVHSYFTMDADGIQTITITPPDAPAWNPLDIYYIVIVQEDGTVSCYGKLGKREPTVIDLGGNTKGTVYFNAFYDDHPEYVYVKEAIVVSHKHDYLATVTPPTCTEQGYTTYTCTVCGDSYVDTYVDAAGHSFGGWAEVTAPACDREGKDQRVCTVCGEIQHRDTRISGDPNQILVSDPVEEGFYSGKKIVCIGDSITYGVGVENRSEEAYPHLIAELLDITAVNLGVSGSGYCTGGRMATNKTLTEANIRDADVVTIMLGINDWAWSVKEGFWNGVPGYYDEGDTYYQLGEFGSDDTSTFYGALKWWCETITAMKKLDGFEEKQFVVITPMITSWNNSMGGKRDWDQSKTNVHGHTLRQYCTAILEVCAAYGIPVFDANMFSGIYYRSAEDNNVAEAGGDGVHVNAVGHALLADALAEFLLEGYRYENREVAHCGHRYESAVTPPTCTERGYTTYTCTLCCYSYVDAYVDAAGHSYSAGLCTVCGDDTVTAALEGNTFTLTGELKKGTCILVACYDGDGRFSGLVMFEWKGSPITEEIPAGERVRVFFTDGIWNPLRPFIPLK